jgi:hypothetical protein
MSDQPARPSPDGQPETSGCDSDSDSEAGAARIDLQDLAERVFALLRDEVRIERERLGRN